jgi:hypothetical protein
MSIMDYKQFEGHTPAKQWTTYSMGADNPYHAVRIGGEGFDLPITKGADARLLAAAPELLAENRDLREQVHRLYSYLERVDEDAAFEWATKNVGEDDMWIVRGTGMSAEEFGAESFDDDDDDDEFESEFSKGDMLNLKKYIDYPISWINKQIAPSNERKARKFEQKERGQIPTKREPEDFRQSIKTPTWFKAVQLGLIASVVGVMGLVDTKRTTDEEPEEPEEQKEE